MNERMCMMCGGSIPRRSPLSDVCSDGCDRARSKERRELEYDRREEHGLDRWRFLTMRSETEKTIEWLYHLSCTDRSYPERAVAALRACEKIRELCVEQRRAGYYRADLDALEELLP